MDEVESLNCRYALVFLTTTPSSHSEARQGMQAPVHLIGLQNTPFLILEIPQVLEAVCLKTKRPNKSQYPEHILGIKTPL